MLQRGATSTELTVGALVGAIVLLIAIPTISVIGSANAAATTRPTTQSSAVDMVTAVAGAFQKAALYNGCPVSAAAASDATIYTDTSGNTIRYYISGGSLLSVSGGNTFTLATNATLTITYYSSASYNTTSLVSFTPTTVADFAKIEAVKVSGTVVNNGYTQTFTAVAKLRNCPAKTTPFS